MFPAKIRLGPHSIGYLENEIEDFLAGLASRRSIR
jgi:predicted DNA-binding transcriptional regulator AlpA